MAFMNWATSCVIKAISVSRINENWS